VAVVSRNLLNEDGRVSNGAVRNMIAMKGQNMKREEMDQAPKTVAHGVQVNVQANVQNSPAIGVDDIVQARQRIQEWRNERFAEPAEENEAANGTADAGRDPV
jgi:hypothetical protein